MPSKHVAVMKRLAKGRNIAHGNTGIRIQHYSKHLHMYQ